MRCALLVPFLLLVACGQNAFPAGSGGGGTLQKIVDRGYLIVGLEVPFIPFEYLDDDGELTGFDVELARLYAADLEVDIRFEKREWTALQAALATRQIDMIWSGMTATVPRSRRILFSDTYFRTQLLMLVRKDSAFTSAAQLDGRKLVVKLGTTGEYAAAVLFPKSELLKLDDDANCANEVVNGNVAGFLYDEHTILRYHRKREKTTRILSDIDSFEPYAVALRPDDYALWRSVNIFLERLRWNSRYGQLHRKYFDKPPPDERR